MFKEQLKAAMERAGMNQKQLAEATGISRPTISEYLKGSYVPKDAQLEKLSKVLSFAGVNIPEKQEKQLEIDTGSFEDVEKFLLSEKNVSVKEAAILLGVGQQHVKLALQQGTAPYGYAVKCRKTSEDTGDRYVYHISPKKLMEYQIFNKAD
ncbi:MAG: helix-turn-helix domain-containing protein [Eubacterium sp.]|nr:helix-turn-helix domain-containing protein [Eubacterium sp.]